MTFLRVGSFGRLCNAIIKPRVDAWIRLTLTLVSLLIGGRLTLPDIWLVYNYALQCEGLHVASATNACCCVCVLVQHLPTWITNKRLA
jgi:hypothetical protein